MEKVLIRFGWADGGSDWEEWAYAETSRAAVDKAAMGSGGRVGRRQRAAAIGSGGWVGTREKPAGVGPAAMGNGRWVGRSREGSGRKRSSFILSILFLVIYSNI